MTNEELTVSAKHLHSLIDKTEISEDELAEIHTIVDTYTGILKSVLNTIDAMILAESQAPTNNLSGLNLLICMLKSDTAQATDAEILALLGNIKPKFTPTAHSFA